MSSHANRRTSIAFPRPLGSLDPSGALVETDCPAKCRTAWSGQGDLRGLLLALRAHVILELENPVPA